MKKCPRCGKLSRSDAKFCKYCGYRFPVQAQSNTKGNYVPKKACPHCGYMNRPNAKFCVNCGKSLIGNPKPQQNSATPRKVQPQSKSQIPHNSVKSNVTSNSNQANAIHQEAQSQLQTHEEYSRPRTQNNTTDINNHNPRPDSNGYRRVSNNQSQGQGNQATHPNYTQSWQKANQSFNKATNYSNNYFQWIKGCFLHPSHTNMGHPMFGITSFIIEAVILFLAGVLTKINGDDQIFYSMRALFNSFPISNMYNAQSFFNPISCLFMAACSFVILVGANYLCQTIGSNGHKANFFSTTNELASDTILALPALGLTLISVLISSSTLTQLFAFVSALILNGGLAITVYKMLKFSKMDCIYWVVIVLVANFLASGIVNMILSTLINAGQ